MQEMSGGVWLQFWDCSNLDLGKVDVGSNLYIGIEMIFLMTAITIGWSQAFLWKGSRFSGQTLIVFSEESWGNPPWGYTCWLVPSVMENIWGKGKSMKCQWIYLNEPRLSDIRKERANQVLVHGFIECGPISFLRWHKIVNEGCSGPSNE